MTLVERFRDHLASLQPGAGRILVAVSGGADSLALLDLLKAAAPDLAIDLVVGHVDHGIHPDSDQVADRVRDVAAGYGLPFSHYRVHLDRDTGETAARAARHAALEALRLSSSASWIALGHHAGDQAETVLMRLLRGSGPAGLAGMEPRSGRLLRPLLPFQRSELVEHLERQGIGWWEDPANSDRRHDRSWLRHDIIPALRDRLPELDGHLTNTASQAAVERAAMNQVLDVLPGLGFRREDRAMVSVAGPRLADYDSSLALALIKALGRRVGRTVGWRDAERILDLVSRGASGRTVELGGPWAAELSFGRLRLGKLPGEYPEAERFSLVGRGETVWGRWRISWDEDRAPETQERRDVQSWLVPGPIEVRSPSPGDRLRPLGGNGSRPVARCFQEARVPRSRRSSWPVLARGGGIVWIPGVCRAAHQVPAPGTEAVRVDVRYV